MASHDSLSQALAARRGKSLDHRLMSPEEEAMESGAHGATDLAPAGGPQHLGEHTPVAHESTAIAAVAAPHSTETGVSDGAMHAELRDHVGGHETEAEFERLKGHEPRSLGERAKMGALKEKYDKK